MTRSFFGIRDWTPSARREPVLRIGIVLEEDGAQELRVALAGGSFAIQAGDDPGESIETSELEFHKVGDAVAFRVAGGADQKASRWSIGPTNQGAASASGGIVVRDVIAGRGFHWQKRIDQTLPGAVEIRAGESGLVLINEVALEQYLACVITSEMGGRCPLEFLKAQCVVARSWLLAMSEDKHGDQPFDRCNDDCCQRYHGLADLSEVAVRAVKSTRGLSLLGPSGSVVDANYSKCCGGVSEAPEYVWGAPKDGISVVTDAPLASVAHQFHPVNERNLDNYLRGLWLRDNDVYCGPNVVTPEMFGQYLGRVDESGDYFRWEHRVGRGELEDRLRSEVEKLHDLGAIQGLVPRDRGPSGRASALDVVYVDRENRARRYQIDGELTIRRLLSSKFLYSSAFDVTAMRDSDEHAETFVLRGAGWGHGVGFCQMGGLGMALKGRSNDEILAHYFPKARTDSLYA